MAASYLTHLARLAGPVCVGLSVWCAAGVVTVESSAGASARLMAPAPWWVLLIGVVIAALVPGWRRAPLTTLPALVATVPWWPIPLPAVALLWTGPLAWLPILAALAAAEGSRWLGAAGAWVRAHDVRRATILAAVLTGLMGGATLWSLRPVLPGGDEPHYLIITQSLWRDGDLRIENNHQQRDYAEYFGGTLRPDFINRGQDGEIYSIHAPGVSVLVLPGFAAFGLAGAQLTVWLCLVVTGGLVWRMAWRATQETSAAWFAWASVMGSASLLLLGVMVFPDAPAALATAAATWLLVQFARAGDYVRTRHLVVVSSLLAAMPWLHTRLVILAIGFGTATLIAVWRQPGRATPERARRAVAFLVMPILSAAGWFLQFWLIYGTADPRAPYRGAEQIRDWVWGAVAGLYADQQFGLLAFAPVLVAAAVGAFRSTGPLRWVCGALGVTLVVYTLAVARYHMWWAGLPGLPARFLTATLPMFALPLAIGWHRATSAGRAVLLALLAVSSAITVLLVAYNHGQFAFNMRHGQAAWLEWLGPVVNLPRAWPSYFWRTEQDFLVHLAAWAGVWALGWVAFRILVRRHRERPAVARLGVAVWIVAGLMGAAEAGWRLNGVSGLDPARSQLAAHAAPRVWPEARRLRLSIAPDEPPLSDRPTPVVMVVRPVPAGDYRVRVEGAGLRESTLTARIGRSQTPAAVWSFVSGGATVFPLSLPAGAGDLVLEADSPESAAAMRVTLEPAGPAFRGGGMARSMAREGSAIMFFLDDHAFVEPTGFWVRGGRRTEVVWSEAGAAGRTRELRFRNGGAANVITVQQSGWREVLELDAWQEAGVTLPAADATGSWRVTIHAAAGFRPSEAGDSGDDRYLGVWVVR